MSKLLLDENPLVIQPQLAVKIGLNEAIFIQQIHYWIYKSDKEIDGKIWTYNSYEELHLQFPFWGIRTIKRIVKNLTDNGFLFVENHNKDKWNKTNWYALNYDALKCVIDSDNVARSGECQSGMCDSDNVARSLMGSETSTETSTETSRENTEEIYTEPFKNLNSYQKIDVLQSKLNKHIGIVKTKIFRDDMFAAKELVEQIEDPNDFVSAYVEHKKSLKDKKYLKGMFAFMAEYVDGTMKSAKKLEDDYAITVHDEWTKLDDGNFHMLNGHVINPFTGKIIPGYWDNQARL